ncbi:MAG: nucleoside-diphosphate kinase [Treponema sp.]|nr:nucleoside-diphosphate kinase [Treponema sp.]
MNDSLSYVMVTPYTIAKSRTGGVIARLLSQLDLELVGAQMIAPDAAFTKAYGNLLREQGAPLLPTYVEQKLFSQERAHRTLLLLFRGKDPCAKLSGIVGAIYSENRSVESIAGETIRDTYADLIVDHKDSQRVTYFEPAVLTPRNEKDCINELALIRDFLTNQPNLVSNIAYPDPSKIEKTLVILKPDNWAYASSKPGTIIDMFSRTGMRIVGMKVHQFTLEQALEFYGPVEAALKEKLAPIFGKKAAEVLEREFGIALSGEANRAITESFGREYARSQFRDIIEFMSGCRPGREHKEGRVKTLILVYEGENAVQKIRDVLGPTDPLKAPGGTIRREFGSNVMVNTAHASDSRESYAREQAIVRINENNFAALAGEYVAHG